MTTRILFLFCGLLAVANLSAQGPAKPSQITTFEVKAQRLSNTTNAQVADFAPIRYGERVYFSSTRQTNPGDMPVSRIFSFTPGEQPTVDAEFNPKKSTKHVACPTLMPDASRMYFTICSDEGMTKCELWYRDREFEGTWGPAVKLPEHINLRGSNNTQPAIGFDAWQKKYVLYFASNRPGGKGKMDIWACSITFDGKFEEPTCLPFNTPEDEVTPSFNQTGQTLYFSSNGLKGTGRLDVFSMKKDKTGNWAKPENMGRPFNSGYDDLFFTYHEPSQTGYLASDRPGSQCSGSIEGFNCFDIYELKKVGKLKDAEVVKSGGK
jgi:WD40-like Beta Propeller Repeat